MISTIFRRTGNDVSLASTYYTGDGSAISANPAYCKTDENFISVGQASKKRDGNFMLQGYHYNRIDNNQLSIGHASNKTNYNFIPILRRCEKGNDNLMSIGPNYYKSHENFVAMDTFYNKANEVVSAGPTYDNREIDITSIASIHDQQDATVASLGTVYSKRKFQLLSIPYLSPNQSSAQPLGALGQEDLLKCPRTNIVSACTSKTGSGPKIKNQKTTKKIPSNNFPSNVKILLSTGILDGVPVKYISWSRENNLRGVVKGTGYLCDCKECKLSKAISAYEFERHAGCKTKHPNGHIYFENGKTIVAVVQELKSTPQNMLFEAIENVTGSPVNQENFRTWKASYQAATRELQHSFGKDEVVVPS
ncbi:hypothetical protein Adt_13354 [Abeliophyllum distichum]|uniref:Tify domain-containing protein n=1 Tax=Abeliophyllum distichum TaxID=126358 RepID=A0ABD1TWJ4_9LAMI